LIYLYVNRFAIAQKLTELEHKTIERVGGHNIVVELEHTTIEGVGATTLF
jgi:hypothetical protein